MRVANLSLTLANEVLLENLIAGAGFTHQVTASCMENKCSIHKNIFFPLIFFIRTLKNICSRYYKMTVPWDGLARIFSIGSYMLINKI